LHYLHILGLSGFLLFFILLLAHLQNPKLSRLHRSITDNRNAKPLVVAVFALYAASLPLVDMHAAAVLLLLTIPLLGCCFIKLAGFSKREKAIALALYISFFLLGIAASKYNPMLNRTISANLFSEEGVLFTVQ
jgi:hypothetical protein